MSIFLDILKNSPGLAARIEAFENAADPDSEMRISTLAGTDEGKQWFRVRRLVSCLVWDIYTAAAIAHYRKENPAETPLLKEKGVWSGVLPADAAAALEREYFQCPPVPWADERPPGYSFFPHKDGGYFGSHDKATAHRSMTPGMGRILTEAFTRLAPEIERIMGHYWTAGAARLFSAKPRVEGNFHSDQFPLGIKKLMIYPSGADLEKGSTEFILADGKKDFIKGGKGVWVIFENTLRMHRALAPQKTGRPTVELTIIPSFKTDTEIRHHGIHVGYPWLPADADSLTGGTCPAGFTAEEVKERTLRRLLLLSILLPQNADGARNPAGLGFYDI
jgi:hypothetical protein